jgi:hypothetical protein
MTDEFVDKMMKELISVQPIHKDKKVVEAFNFLMTDKNWSITLVNQDCQLGKVFLSKLEEK